MRAFSENQREHGSPEEGELDGEPQESRDRYWRLAMVVARNPERPPKRCRDQRNADDEQPSSGALMLGPAPIAQRHQSGHFDQESEGKVQGVIGHSLQKGSPLLRSTKRLPEWYTAWASRQAAYRNRSRL